MQLLFCWSIWDNLQKNLMSYQLIKRLFDIFFSVIAILVFAPIFSIISILILIFDNGPIIFKQKRIGHKNFTIYKFRTLPITTQNVPSIYLDKIKITTIGKLLRRTNADELPQLLNILKGDMSFVGPRPDVPGYADLLKGNNRNILKLRPGITSRASIKYANEEKILLDQEDPIAYNNDVIFPDKVKMNLNYYENNNIWIDIKIIFATLYTLFE